MAVDWKHTQAVLQDYARDAAEIYKRQLQEHGHLATGELIQSVRTEVAVGRDTIGVAMDLAKYWQYVEWDTRPHWSPPGCLEKWIVAKKLLPMRGSTLPEHKQLKTLDFLIRRKIAREGTQGTHSLADTIGLVNKDYYPKIMDALALDVIESYDKIIIHTFQRV